MAGVDRGGYTITEQAPPNEHGQTTWRVNRKSDGAGLGAFHDDEGIDAAISADREWLRAQQEEADKRAAEEDSTPTGDLGPDEAVGQRQARATAARKTTTAEKSTSARKTTRKAATKRASKSK